MDYGLWIITEIIISGHRERKCADTVGTVLVPRADCCWKTYINSVIYDSFRHTLSIATKKEMVCPYTNPVLELLPNAGVAVMLLMMLSTSASFSMLERVNSAY